MNCPWTKPHNWNGGSSGQTRHDWGMPQSTGSKATPGTREPIEFLHSSSDEDTPDQVMSVRITDKGSIPQCVRVSV